jgi:hypothetical protein
MQLFLKPHYKTLFVDFKKKYTAFNLEYGPVRTADRDKAIAGEI